MDARPVILIVVDDEELRDDLSTLLERRYAADYQVMATASAGVAGRLHQLAAAGGRVAVAIAPPELTGTDGVELLAAVRAEHPDARRVLLVRRGDWGTQHEVRRAIVIGLVDSYLFVPWGLAETWLYQPMAESLSAWSLTQPPEFEVIQLVGTRRDRRSHELRDLFTRARIPYGFYDAESASGQRLLAGLGLDSSVLPVVCYRGPGAYVKRAPSDSEVMQGLGFHTDPVDTETDVVIVGAGPGGLSAAVYASSEGLHTVLLDALSIGGQAGTSSMIRNYLGFPHGLSGSDLTNRALEQAWLFGADTLTPKMAMRLQLDGDRRVVHATDGSRISARCVVIATGVSWRRLHVPAVEERVGAGVFYGSSAAEAALLDDQQVMVVGGGNSAGQAVAHLAEHAAHVTVLVRRESLAASMSQYLIQQLAQLPNVTVRPGSEVVDAHGDGRLEALTVRDMATGEQQALPAAALFVMIGGEPRTGWLDGTLAMDEQGYLLTGAQLDADLFAALGRAPLYLETSVPGVFAAGDVRHGSVKRVAPSVGSGAIAVQLIHEYLATDR